MSATKTLAFVLNRQDYRDTSLLVDLFTREHGRVRGIVKGVRDSRARFGSTFEPFSLNEILFYKRRRGGDLHLVTQAELVDGQAAVHEDLERFATACYCMELVSELVETDEPAPEIFELIRDVLSLLAGGSSPRRAARIFEIKLLDALGLMPEVRSCVFCRVEPEGAAYFSAAAGGIHCAACGNLQKGMLGGASLPVSKGARGFLEHVQRAPVTALAQVKVAREVGAELERVLRRFTDFQLNHKLKTLSFMEKLGIA